MSKEPASVPDRPYVSESPSSTSVAVTGAPTSVPGSALSDTLRSAVADANAGASLMLSIVSATVATAEVRPPVSLAR